MKKYGTLMAIKFHTYLYIRIVQHERIIMLDGYLEELVEVDKRTILQ